MLRTNSGTGSVLWSAIERFSVQGVSFVLTLVIARLVLPEEYGLIAMLSIFISIAQTFVDSGFSNALIQKQGRTDTDCSTVFYFNIIVGLLFYLFLFVFAPYIADFYHEPRLIEITRWVALSFVFSSLSVVQRALLTIRHDFKSQAIASFISVILSGALGVLLAFQGYGVWALVAQTLTNQFVSSVLLWIFTKWNPLIAFSFDSFKTLFSFGSKLLLSSLINTIYTNIYTIIIGRYYKASDLGYYSNANQLSQFSVISLANVLHRAIYPYQCELQNDDVRLHKLFLQYLRISAYISFPIMIAIISLAEPFVRVVLTEKWLPCVPMIRILGVAYLFYVISHINCQMLNVKGKSGLFLRAEIIKKVVAVSLLITALPFGIKALCWSMAINGMCDLFIIIPFVKKVTPTGFLEELKCLLTSLCLSVTAGLVAFVPTLLFVNFYLQLLIGFILFCALYLGLSIILKLQEYTELKGFINKIFVK